MMDDCDGFFADGVDEMPPPIGPVAALVGHTANWACRCRSEDLVEPVGDDPLFHRLDDRHTVAVLRCGCCGLEWVAAQRW